MTPLEIGWAENEVVATGVTPEPPVLEDAPARTWLLAQFVSFFGGTKFGGAVLNAASPDGISWDGSVVKFRRPLGLDLQLERVHVLLPLVDVTLTATVTHDSRGLWIKFNAGRSAVLSLLRTLLPHIYGASLKP